MADISTLLGSLASRLPLQRVDQYLTNEERDRLFLDSLHRIDPGFILEELDLPSRVIPTEDKTLADAWLFSRWQELTDPKKLWLEDLAARSKATLEAIDRLLQGKPFPWSEINPLNRRLFLRARRYFTPEQEI